jgi:hypothetical protein
MVKYCGHCGQQIPDDSVFCTACGRRLQVTGAQVSTGAGTLGQPPQPQWPGGTYTQPDTIPGLGRLRSAFFWIFVGSIVAVVPFVGVAGAIIALVGFVLLLTGFGQLSQSALADASYYRSTRNWLLAALILGLGLAVSAGALLATLILGMITGSSVTEKFGVNNGVSTISATAGSVTGPASLVFSSASGAEIALLAFLALAGLVVYLVAYLKVAHSLKLLGGSLSLKALVNAGNYLVYSIVTYAAMYVALPLLITFFLAADVKVLSANNTLSGTFTTVAPLAGFASLAPFIGLFALVALFSLVGWILQLLAYHSAYSGIDEYTRGRTTQLTQT